MKVVIIGNGGSILKNKNGEFIDSCDKVIRMKQYVTDGYEEHTGTKVDIYASKWFSWFENKPPYHPNDMTRVSSVDQYWFTFCDPYIKHIPRNSYLKNYLKYSLKNDTPLKDGDIETHEKYISHFKLDTYKIRYYPYTLINKLAYKLKLSPVVIKDKKDKPALIEPSVGIRVIQAALMRFRNAEIYITGFDCFLQSSWYWDSDHVINNDHNYMNERIYLTTLIHQGKLIDISNESF